MRLDTVRTLLGPSASVAGRWLCEGELKWLKTAGVSVALHVFILPAVFFFIYEARGPAAAGGPVFMLSGGLKVVQAPAAPARGWDEEEDDDEEEASVEDEEDEEEEEEEDVRPVRSAGKRKPSSISFEEFDLEDEEDLLDAEAKVKTASKDDEEDEEEEEDDEEEGDGVKEKKGGAAQSAGKKQVKWEELFAKKARERSPGGGGEGAAKPAAKERTEADRRIEELVAVNPYEGEGDGAGGPGSGLLVTGSFFGEGDAQLPDLLLWLPSDTKMAGMISLSMLRARPDRALLEETFTKLPYFDSIAAGSNLSLFDQLDAVMIATNNPFDVKETHLTLRHNQDEKMIRKAVGLHFEALGVKANWYRIGGKDVVQPPADAYEKVPWVYFFPDDKVIGVIHFSQRERLQTLIAESVRQAGEKLHIAGPLEKMMRTGMAMPKAAEEEGASIPASVVFGCVQFDQLYGGALGMGRFPLPGDAVLAGRFGQKVIGVEAAGYYKDPASPKAFLEEWLKATEALKKNKMVQLFGIDKIMEYPVWKDASGGNLTFQAALPADKLGYLLAFVRLITGAEKPKK